MNTTEEYVAIVRSLKANLLFAISELFSKLCMSTHVASQNPVMVQHVPLMPMQLVT